MALTRIAAQPNPQRTIEAQARAALTALRAIDTAAAAYLANAAVIGNTATAAQVRDRTKAMTADVQTMAKVLVGLCRIVGKQLDAAG